ncbi:MAG: hypothetical protein ACFFBP_02940 [Promethearchaeota archaeon]
MLEITQNQIVDALSKNYQDIEFVNLMREIITDTIDKNSVYRELANKQGYQVDNLNTIKDIETIPYIPAVSYKESGNLYKKLLKIPEDQILHWNCSSTTNGDPSLVGTNQQDMDFLLEMSRKAFLDFIPRDWDNARVHLFSPSPKMLNRLCMRYTKQRPIIAYSGNYYTAAESMVENDYLFTFSILKALKAIIKTGKIVGGFYIKQSRFLEYINKNLKAMEEKKKYAAMGGSNLLILQFLKYMEDNNIQYNLGDRFDVVIGGGGWDGHKAQLKYNPIPKSYFVSKISELFGVERNRVVDMYSFTECPILFGSHWSDKHEDFVFHCPPYARILVRDIDTLEPLTKEGDRGFLEVLTPFGSNASVKHAVGVDDRVELISKNKCPECGYEGSTFRVLGRYEKKEGLGCSSLVTWI